MKMTNRESQFYTCSSGKTVEDWRVWVWMWSSRTLAHHSREWKPSRPRYKTTWHCPVSRIYAIPFVEYTPRKSVQIDHQETRAGRFIAASFIRTNKQTKTPVKTKTAHAHGEEGRHVNCGYVHVIKCHTPIKWMNHRYPELQESF